MEALGLRLRGPLHPEEDRQRYASSKRAEDRSRAQRASDRQTRRRQFWRDVTVQFVGSVAAAYFIVLMAVLVGFLDDPGVVSNVVLIGMVLLGVFLLYLAAVTAFWGSKYHPHHARYGYEHTGDDREELQYIAARFLMSLVGAVVLAVIGLLVLVLGGAWAVSLR